MPTLGFDAKVTLVDGAGAAVSVGGGTQYADGATQANPTGNVILWLDTSNVLRAPSAAKPLPVNVVSGSGSGVSVTDAAAWTTASSVFVPGGGVFNDSAAVLVSGTQGTQRLTTNRAAHMNLRTAAGVEIGIAAAPSVAGGALTNNAAAPAATNVGALTAVANAAVPSYTEGRLVALSMDLGGLLRVDTEMPPAALNGDTFDSAATAIPMVGTLMHGLTQGATTVSRIKAHDGGSDDRGTTINGLVTAAYGYIYDGTNWDRQRSSGVTGMAGVGGDTAHDGVDAGNPVKIGMRAIAHGTNPTAVAAADRTDWLANRAGIPFMMGGHPNIQTIRATYSTAQTDVAVIAVSTGTKIVVTGFMCTVSNATTVNVSVLLGFATATTPTTSQVIGAHLGIAPGSGFGRGGGSGIIGIGADDEDLRITAGAATTGALDVCVSYYTIAT